MKTTKHKLLIPAITVLAFSSLSSRAAVTLTVAESGGGITVTASGNIDTSGVEFSWNSDDGGFPFSGIGPSTFDAVSGGSDYEQWDLTSAAYSYPSTFSFDSVSGGAAGNGISVSSSQLFIFGTDAFDNGFAPASTSFNFTFVATDLDGDISDYSDGAVLWDSNGAAAGGETITFSVAPEPTSFALLGLGGLCLVSRRRRA